MNKLYLTSALLAIFALPAFADINKNASTATCDSATIGATSGTAYMDTDWTANTINLDFYSDGEKISTGSCTYDGSIELPEDPEDKTGYTFGGWQLRRAPAQTTFNLSTLNASTNGIVSSSKNFAGNFCYYDNNDTNAKVVSDTCTESQFTGLSTGEWRTTFSYGTVRGEAYCSGKRGDNHLVWDGESSDWTATESELTSASGTARYCWCKPTGFDAEGDGTYQNVGVSSWVFLTFRDDAAECVKLCTANCGYSFKVEDLFRSAVFGQNQ